MWRTGGVASPCTGGGRVRPPSAGAAAAAEELEFAVELRGLLLESMLGGARPPGEGRGDSPLKCARCGRDSKYSSSRAKNACLSWYVRLANMVFRVDGDATKMEGTEIARQCWMTSAVAFSHSPLKAADRGLARC